MIPILGTIKAITSGLTVGMSIMLGMALGALPTWGLTVLYYEGGPDIDLPLFPVWHVPPQGKIERLVDEADRRCQMEKKASLEAAERFDLTQQLEAAQQHAEELRQANERVLASQTALREFKEVVDVEMQELAREANKDPNVRTIVRCDVGPRGAAGLRGADLPYPDTIVPRN